MNMGILGVSLGRRSASKLHGMQEVRGSNPLSSTTQIPRVCGGSRGLSPSYMGPDLLGVSGLGWVFGVLWRGLAAGGEAQIPKSHLGDQYRAHPVVPCQADNAVMCPSFGARD